MTIPAPLRVAAESRALDDALAAVSATRPHLIDAWEAMAVAESLGYTGDRVRRELGFESSHAFGQFVFDRLSERATPPAPGDAVPLPPAGIGLVARASALNTLLYALLWTLAMVADRIATPLSAGPPLTLALMPALIVAGGVLYGMSHRSGAYHGMEQPAFASVVSSLLWRLGAMLTVVVAAAGLLAGWVSRAAGWPGLVIWADEFVVLSAVLLIGGRVIANGGSWRQSAAAEPRSVPMPHLGIVLVRTLPIVVIASACLATAFAERLIAFALGVDRSAASLAIDLAVLPLLAALAVVELVTPRFSASLAEATDAASGMRSALQRAAVRAHWKALVAVSAVYLAAAIGAAAIAPAGVFVGAGYLLLALGMLNARVLLTLGHPWGAGGSMAAGLGVACAAAVGLGVWLGGWDPGLALLPGAAVAFAASFAAVRIVLRRPDRALLRA